MPYYAAGSLAFVRRSLKRVTRRQMSTLFRRLAKGQTKAAKRSLAARFIPFLKTRLR